MFCFFLNAGSDDGVSARHVVQTFHQGFEVKHGAAHQQWQLAPTRNLLDTGQCITRKFCRAVGVEGIANVDQVMRHSVQLCQTGLGRANVHAFVYQGGVDADDFSAASFFQVVCHCHGQACFAAGGGSCNGNCMKFHFVTVAGAA